MEGIPRHGLEFPSIYIKRHAGTILKALPLLLQQQLLVLINKKKERRPHSPLQLFPVSKGAEGLIFTAVHIGVYHCGGISVIINDYLPFPSAFSSKVQLFPVKEAFIEALTLTALFPHGSI